jgi:hypothetical protein
LKQRQGPRVLLATKDELRLFLPLRHLTPGGHRHGHEDGHDAHGYEQRCHRITIVSACERGMLSARARDASTSLRVVLGGSKDQNRRRRDPIASAIGPGLLTL